MSDNDDMEIEEKFAIADDVVHRLRRFHLKLQLGLALVGFALGAAAAWVITRD